MPNYWKNVSTLNLDQVTAELEEIAKIQARKKINGDLAKRKRALEQRLKKANKMSAHA